MPLAFWNLMSAERVALPNLLVSLPGEPGPLSATRYPLAFSHCCSALTSAPLMPSSKLRAKAAVTVPVVALPLSAALTLSMVAWSAPNEERSVRIASTCVAESPDAGVDAGGVEGAGITDAAEPPPPPPPPPPLPTSPTGPPPPLEVLLVSLVQAVLEGVTVTAFAPETAGMVIVLTPLLQTAVRPPIAGSVVTERFGALMVMVEADCSVAVKVVAPTAIVSTVALEPLTLMLTLFTESTTSVVSVTSLYAANASVGRKSAMTTPVRVSNFFIIMNSYKP